MSFEPEMKTGTNANGGSEHSVANFSSKLLLPIPQSPRIANELVRPVARPCCKAWRKMVICNLRPMNWFGLAGKLGSGSISALRNHRNHNRQFTFVIVVIWAGRTMGRRAYTSPIVQMWKELRSGFCFYGWEVGESVHGLRNEGAVFNEGVVVERLWAADPEFHECKRDPLVAFLDDPSFAENRLVQDNIMRVGVVRHDAPPCSCGFEFCGLLGLWKDGGGDGQRRRLQRDSLTECLSSARQAGHSSGSSASCHERCSTVKAGRPSRRSSSSSSAASSAVRL